jgi:TldD protein
MIFYRLASLRVHTTVSGWPDVTNTESTGVGVRVVCNGAYGFAATNDMTPDGIAGAARQAAAIAQANAKLQSDKVQLAPVKGVGEVAWATSIVRDWRMEPIKDKAELLIAANKAGMDAGASFMQSMLFQVQQQKYFASTDGSYIDQDIQRPWAPFTATAVDKASGKFRSRAGLSAPVGLRQHHPPDPEDGRVHRAAGRGRPHRALGRRRGPGAPARLVADDGHGGPAPDGRAVAAAAPAVTPGGRASTPSTR